MKSWRIPHDLSSYARARRRLREEHAPEPVELAMTMVFRALAVTGPCVVIVGMVVVVAVVTQWYFHGGGQ